MSRTNQSRNRLSRRTLVQQTAALSGGLAASRLLPDNAVHAVAAAQSTPVAGDPVYGGNLIYARPTDAPFIDPHFGNIAAHRVMALVYDTVLKIDNQGRIVPSLAESWELEGDTIYTFVLRQDVLWHNGRPFVADDVKASFERLLDPDVGASRRGDLLIIDTIEVVDPHTVRFTLSSTNAGFPAMIADIFTAVLPPELYQEGDPRQEAVGTGPFKVESWVPDSQMVLVANEDYYILELPYLDSITVQVVPEESSIIAGLRGGSIHQTTLEDNKNFFLVENDPLKTLQSPRLGMEFLVINNGIPPLDNQLVRQAIAYAIDREEILQLVLQGLGRLTGPLPPALEEWAVPVEEFDTYTPDRERATALLAEAGFPDGFTIELAIIPTFPTFVAAATAIAAQLQTIGIQVQITQIEYGIWLERLNDLRDMPLTMNLTQGVADPDPYLYGRFHSEGFNQPNWNEPEVDELLEQGRAETDPAARKQIYDRLQRMLADEKIPYIWLYSPDLIDISQENVIGYEQHPSSFLFGMAGTWIGEQS